MGKARPGLFLQKNPKKYLKRFQYTAIASILLSFMSQPLYASPGAAIFELDGNAKHDAGGALLPDDWESLISGGHALVTTGNGASRPNIQDPNPMSIFTQGGSKDINNVSQWRWNNGSVPDKDDLTNAFAAAYKADKGDEIIFFGADRLANNGDAQMGFWFFKDNVTLNPNGTFKGQHVVGDILVLVKFTQGGSVPLVEVLKWVGVGGDQKQGTLQTLIPLEEAKCGPASDPNVCAITNNGGEQAFWSYSPKSGQPGIYPAQSFFEGGINISALIGNSVCFSSFMAETRSSTDVDSQLKDFVLGSFPVCSVKIAKVCAPSTVLGSSVKPNYTITAISTGAAIPAAINLADNQCGSGSPVNYSPVFDSNGTAIQNGSCNLTAPFNLPIVNSVTATAVDSAGNPIKVEYDEQACDQGSSNACSVNCPVTLNSNLRVTKQCAVHLVVGDDGQYKIKVNFTGVVENTGDTDLNDISIVDNKAGNVIFSKKPHKRKGAYYLPAHESLVFSGSYTPTGAPGDMCPTDALFTDHVTVTAKDVIGNVITGVADASCGLCTGSCPRIP